MRNNPLFRFAAALLAVGSLLVLPAKASLLSPGQSILALPNEVGPVGATLLNSMNASFSGVDFGNNVLFSGTLTSSVWSGDTSNPFTGGLTFTYQLTSALSSQNSIDRLTMNPFTGFLTDVSYNGAGTVPSRVSRPTSELIAFVFEDSNFLPTFAPGSSSPTLVIQTDASFWAVGSASVIDGATANVPALVTAVPEPATFAIVLLGGLALAVRKRN